jgi:putative ABC transport system permease protein
MYKQYIKQAWQLMKQNRFYTAVYILGTGLAISLVMTMAIVYHIKTADIAPEVNRSRMLLCRSATGKQLEGQGQYTSSLSYLTVKECFYSLETPACVTALVTPASMNYFTGKLYTGLPGSGEVSQTDVACTDAAFWQVFSFAFTGGGPYSEEEFLSGYRKAVVCESLARKLWGTSEATGKSILINDVEYVVGGVVKDVSPIMDKTYAQAWIPFTAIAAVTADGPAEHIVGMMEVYILAHSPADFDAIRAELEQKRLAYNTSKQEWELILSRVQTQGQEVVWKLDRQSEAGDTILRYGLIALVFLLVPAVNLTGLTSSRMQERIAEMGVRKAFGAGQATLIHQVLTENLLLTLFGGAAGLGVSYLLVAAGRNTLLMDKLASQDAILSGGMLLNLPVFFYALAVCVVLNLLASILPVWNASRRSIVASIYDQ